MLRKVVLILLLSDMEEAERVLLMKAQREGYPEEVFNLENGHPLDK